MKKPLFIHLLILILTFFSYEVHASNDKTIIKQLDNGLTVILAKRKTTKVFFDVVYTFGANQDPVGLEGLAHFTEHMVFRKPSHFQENHFETLPNALGEPTRGMTSYSDTEFYTTSASTNYLEYLIWLSSQRMAYLDDVFTDENVAVERKIILQEKSKSQQYHNELLFDSLLSNTTFYPITGTQETIKKITKNDLKQFYQQYYRPNNAIIVIGGNFDEVQTMKWIKTYFSAIQPFTSEATSRYSRAQKHDKTVYAYLKSDKPSLRIAYRVPYMDLNTNTCATLEFLSGVLEQLTKEDSFSKYKSLNFVTACRKTSTSSFVFFELKGDTDKSLDEQFKLFTSFKSALLSAEDQIAETLSLMVLEEKNRQRSRVSWLREVISMGMDYRYYGDANFTAKESQRSLKTNVNDILTVFNKSIVDAQPAVIQSLVAEEQLAYKPQQESFYQLPENAPHTGQSVAQPLPDKFKQGAKKYLTPPVTDKSFDVYTPPTWSGKLKNGVSVAGITDKNLEEMHVELFLGNISADSVSNKKLAIAKLLEDSVEDSITSALGKKLLINSHVKVRLSSSKQEIVLSLRSVSKDFPAVLEKVMATLADKTIQKASFEKAKANLLEKEPSFSTRYLVDSLYFDNKSQKYILTKDEAYAEYENITWEHTKNFIDKYLVGHLAKIAVVSERDASYVIGMLNAQPSITDADLVPFTLMPNKLNVRLQPGIYMIDKDYEVPYATVITHLPNAFPDPTTNVYTGLIHRTYLKFYVSEKIREKLGISYSPDVFTFSAPDFKQVWADAKLEKKSLALGVETIINSYKKLSSGQGITQKMLDSAKIFKSAKPELNFSTPDGKLEFLALVLQDKANKNYQNEWFKALKKVSVTEINNWAQKHMNPDEYIVIISGNKEALLDEVKALSDKIKLPVFNQDKQEIYN